MTAIIKSPFVWFGGKSKVAHIVWQRLGNVDHYIEPFFGSGAVLLSRPHKAKLETINDADGLLANFWRAVSYAPNDVAQWAANPVNEADLHARHLWLVNRKGDLTERLMADPDWYDVQAAGWWVWGVNSWIGSGFCSGEGPWQNVGGVFAKVGSGQGVKRQLPHLGNTGNGVNRKLPHLGDTGQGVNRQLPHLGNSGRAILKPCDTLTRIEFLQKWFTVLKARMAEVRVACGDWSRVTGPSVLTVSGGICGVFLDPPYSRSLRTDVYANESDCAVDVLAWAKANGNNPKLRICLAGYEGEHNDLQDLGWHVLEWKTAGGFSNQGDQRGRENTKKERLWFSPHCLNEIDSQLGLSL
jgi:DNA adenine methylase